MSGFAIYNEPMGEDGDLQDIEDMVVIHEDVEAALVRFVPTRNGSQFRIEFDLDHVRVHQAADGDVFVTLK